MSSISPRISPGLVARTQIPLLALGFAATVSQAVLLREGMAALGGSELSWALVMGLWLAAMAVGARVGARVDLPWLGAVVPSLLVALAAGGTVLLRAAPALAGAAPGEVAAGWEVPWIWLAAVVPASALGGWAFPVLAARLAPSGPARAYALEAGGALLGGLVFTFVLAPMGSAAALVGTEAICLAALLRRRPLLAALPLLAAIFAVPPAGEVLSQAGWRWARHTGALEAWRETHHERLELGSGPPWSLYGDGRLLAVYPDPWQTALRGNLLMLLSPQPQRVFAVGAVADGMVEVFLRHPVERVALVADDPELPDLVAGWYGGSLRRALFDPRVEIRRKDPVRALAGSDRWDLVLLLDGDPSTLRANRTRSVEFFRRCRAALAPGGRVVVGVGVSDTYRGGAAGRLLDVLAATLGSVFRHVAAIPGEQVLLVAGDDPVEDVLDPEELARRWRERRLEDPVFVPEVLPMLVPHRRAVGLTRELLRAGAPINGARRPEAVLPAMARVEGRGRHRIVGLLLTLGSLPHLVLDIGGAALVLFTLVAGFRNVRWAGEVAAGTVGAAAMGWWFLLLACWQTSRGSVYGEIGGLSAAFMGGAAVGAILAARWSHPQRYLPSLLAGGAGLSALIATPLALRTPLPLVPAFLALGGLVAGAAFPGAARLLGGEDARRASGRGFSADEMGAAAGAVLAGFLLPVAGTVWLALVLTGLLAAAGLTSLLALRQQRLQ